METKPEKSRSIDTDMLCMLALMLLGYIFIHDLMGGTLLSHNAWDSYALQAQAWLEGRLDIGQNYEWLELAVYEGKYYLSFPPLPTLVMLPLVLIFGENTPSNLVCAAYAMLAAAFAYKALRLAGRGGKRACFGALFAVWGSNMLWMSTSGGVWFQAQALNFLLLMMAVYYALSNRRIAAYALVALAVGCRPFSACMFLPLAVYFFDKDKQKPVREQIMGQLLPFVIPAVIAGAYMWYNYARFKNVLEFGHNYLPEFTRAENGQFSLSYVGENLRNMLFRPITLKRGLSLSYPVFDGFAFYVANPLFLLWFADIAREIKAGRREAVRAALIAATVLELMLLCAHKTMGGWQFGARYTVDLIPMAFMYTLLCKQRQLGKLKITIMLAGIMLNAYGALAMTFLH